MKEAKKKRNDLVKKIKERNIKVNRKNRTVKQQIILMESLLK